MKKSIAFDKYAIEKIVKEGQWDGLGLDLSPIKCVPVGGSSGGSGPEQNTVVYAHRDIQKAKEGNQTL